MGTVKRNIFYGTGMAVALLVVGTLTFSSVGSLTLEQYQKSILDPQSGYDLDNIAPKPSHKTHNMAAMKTGTATMQAPAAEPGINAPLAPAVGGQWNYLTPFPPEFNAIHTVTGPNGKVLLVAGSGKNKANFTAGRFTSYIWDPITDSRRMIPTPEDMFCNGHVLLPDGRVLVAGGTQAYTPFKGSKLLYAFNFATEAYERLTPMEVGRWYPSVVTGADGKVLIAAGLNENGIKTNITESFDYKTNTHTRLATQKSVVNYARLHLAHDSSFYIAENGGTTGFWNPYANTFRPVGGYAGPTVTNSTAATCFVGDVRDQNLMKMGGGWPGTNVTVIVDLDAPTPTKRAGPLLKAGKGYLGCVNLPDGNLLEANGGTANSIAGASYEVGMLANVNSQWQAMNPIPTGEHRVYHSMLSLLDSGQVLSMVSNPKGQTSNGSVLVYSPPYVFKGASPTITTAPVEVNYGGSYNVAATATGATVTRMTMTTPSSPTHSMDNNQRYLSLPIVGGKITMPTSGAITPPGWYRLWAVDSLGRVSVAKWIHLT